MKHLNFIINVDFSHQVMVLVNHVKKDILVIFKNLDQHKKYQENLLHIN
jgi:hypothetical protein